MKKLFASYTIIHNNAIFTGNAVYEYPDKLESFEDIQKLQEKITLDLKLEKGVTVTNFRRME